MGMVIYDVVAEPRDGRPVWLLLRCEGGEQFPVEMFDQRPPAILAMRAAQAEIDYWDILG
jgi:hypothetical protein